jgi:thiol-disulfide isomerase/thioredoxin
MSRKLIVTAALLLAAGLGAQDSADRPYDLMVGDPAPALAIQKWVQGDAVKAFEPGKVYVVEFWATWCGPCVHGMPHLTELQKKYEGKGVRILGINIWDDPAKVVPFLEDEVKMHGKPGKEVMQYTVGIEEKIEGMDPKKPDGGRMSTTWMLPAGRNGIPSAFIVDQKGKIAWIGHPGRMDDALAQIVAGKWDLVGEAKAYATKIAEEKKIEAQTDELFAKLKNGDYEGAYKLGNELVDTAFAKNPMMLNQLAWTIVDPKHKPATQDLDLALKAATRANELTESQDGNVLDTLATVYHQRGDLASAVKWQTLAVKYAKGQTAEEIAQRLAQYEKELAAQPASATKGDKPAAK